MRKKLFSLRVRQAEGLEGNIGVRFGTTNVMKPELYGRRRFVQVLAGATAVGIEPGNFAPPNRAWDEARAIVRSGRLGRIVFSLASFHGSSRGSLFAIAGRVQFVVGEAAPLAVSCQGSRLGEAGSFFATFRYPAFVASFERVHRAAERTVIHGSLATLAIDASGCSVWAVESGRKLEAV